MTVLGNEYTLVEEPAIKYLVNKLGYDYIEGEKLTPEFGERESFRDAVLAKRLRKALKRLNPWINEESLNTSVTKSYYCSDGIYSVDFKKEQ